MNYFEMDAILIAMDDLIKAKFSRSQSPLTLINLFKLMKLKPSEYPFIDYRNSYLHPWFYDGLSPNVDIQTTLLIRMKKIAKKYSTLAFEIDQLINNSYL